MGFLESIWNFIGCYVSEIIALCAFGIAVWQGYVIRAHNKISVRPHIIVEPIVQWNEPQVQILLENVGIGPAMIKSYKVLLDGEEVDLSVKTALTNMISALDIPEISYGGGKVLSNNDAIRQGKTETALSITTKEEYDDKFDNSGAHKELERVQILIEYESLYGKSFSAFLHRI
ncbi:MAG: hypothetical protein ABW088_05310 [Sedimenticola sp.]